eukprot:EG_transcript_7244
MRLCCQPRDRLAGTAPLLLLHAVTEPPAEQLARGLARATGSAVDVLHPAMRYLPGDSTPAALEADPAEARLARLLRHGAVRQRRGTGAVLRLLGAWHHLLPGPLAEALAPDALDAATSTVVHQPLLQAVSANQPDPLAVVLRYVLLFRGCPSQTPDTVGFLRRDEVRRALEVVAAAAPNGEGAATRRRLRVIADSVVYPALGLAHPAVSGVFVEPRRRYDVVVNAAPGVDWVAQVADHLRARRANRQRSVLASGEPAVGGHPDNDACVACRLRDSLHLPRSPLEDVADLRLGGTNLRLSNAPLAASHAAGWLEGLVATVGSTALNVAGDVALGAMAAFGLAPAEHTERRRPYALRVHECHEKDPLIVIDFEADPAHRRDYIGIVRAEEEDKLLAWDWTHGELRGTVRLGMPPGLPAGLYLAKLFHSDGPVESKAFGIYPEDTGVCPLLDKVRVGSGQLNGRLEEAMDDIVWDCSHPTGLDPACVSDRVQEEFRISERCAGCFAKVAQCGRDNCFWRCAVLGSTSRTCKACVKSHCQDSLLACIGVPPLPT